MKPFCQTAFSRLSFPFLVPQKEKRLTLGQELGATQGPDEKPDNLSRYVFWLLILYKSRETIVHCDTTRSSFDQKK